MNKLLIFLTSLAIAFASTASRAEPNKVLSIGMYSEFNGFNLVKSKVMTPATLTVATSMLEGLFAYDFRTYQIVPRLGLKLEEAADRMSATVTLRPNVTFHDGTPFNAKAVVFHYSRLLDPANGLGFDRTIFVALDHVEEVDDLTVRFVLKKPWPSLLSALAIDYSINLIGSPTALQENAEGFNRHPIGTGPFSFVSWQSGDRLIVDRNKNYWDSSAPKVDRVVYRIMPDGNTRFASINAGEIDIMWTDNVAQVIQAKQSSDLKIARYDGATGYGWQFNTSKAPFNDVRVRSAVVQAFDGAAFVAGFLQGEGALAHDFFPNSPWACQGLSWKSYDPTKAAGLVKSVGGPVKVVLTGFTTPIGRRLTGIVQQFMAAAGIQTEVQMIEPSQSGAKIATGDFEMMQWRFTDIGGEPDIQFSLTNFTASRYSSAKVTALLEQARGEPDEGKRKKLYCEISQVFSDDSVVLFPENVPDFLIVRKTIQYLPPNQNNIIRVRDVILQ